MIEKFFTEEQIMLLVLLKKTMMDSEQAEAALSELERLGPVNDGPAENRPAKKYLLDLL